MYAANLAQKARELKREKRKSDTLLFQMLPPSVAQQLKQTQQVSLSLQVSPQKSDTDSIRSSPRYEIRRVFCLMRAIHENSSFVPSSIQVPAEYYEAVTVYFSDIVGFTEIAAENTPLEVSSSTFVPAPAATRPDRSRCKRESLNYTKLPSQLSPPSPSPPPPRCSRARCRGDDEIACIPAVDSRGNARRTRSQIASPRLILRPPHSGGHSRRRHPPSSSHRGS